MRHVGRVLPRAVENAEVLRAGRAGAALRRWEEVVGPLLASKSVPDRYDKGTVWVATQGSAWAQELRLMKPQILERLETMAGERGMFIDIRFGVRPAKTPSPLPSGAAFQAAVPREPNEEGIGGGANENEVVPLRDRPAVPPAPVPETSKPSQETGLTIRERAERRLENWPENKA